MIPTSHNTLQVKKINVELVKNTLKAMKVGTKASIASVTNLSVATCGTILNELVQHGEVIEMELEESSGGRPARQYKLNADYAYVMCLLLKTEGTIHSISLVLVNVLGEKRAEEAYTLEQLDALAVDHLVQEYVNKYNNIHAIGIGIPGVAHEGVIGICDAPLLTGIAIGPMLEQKYNIDVIVENDMNATIYGLYHMQNLDEDKTFAMVTFPKNHFPGAGFIVNGRMVQGHSHFAGEISYFPFDISREEQLQHYNDKEKFIPLAVKVLSSIVTMLNPVSIAVTGSLVTPSMTQALIDGCLDYIPKEHMPTLIVRNDTQDEYVTGMIALTLERLTYRLQLVERK